MPNKKDQMIQKYRERSSRPTTSFNVDHLQDGTNDNNEVSQINELTDIDIEVM